MDLWFAVRKALPESERVAAPNKLISIGRLLYTNVHGIYLLVVRDPIDVVFVRIHSVNRHFPVIFRRSAVFPCPSKTLW